MLSLIPAIGLLNFAIGVGGAGLLDVRENKPSKSGGISRVFLGHHTRCAYRNSNNFSNESLIRKGMK